MILRSCLNDTVEFTGFIDGFGIDNISENDKKSCLFIVDNADYIPLFTERGVDYDKIVPLFGKQAIKNFPKYSKIFSFWRWIKEYFKYFTKQHIILVDNNFPNFKLLLARYNSYKIKYNVKKI